MLHFRTVAPMGGTARTPGLPSRHGALRGRSAALAITLTTLAALCAGPAWARASEPAPSVPTTSQTPRELGPLSAGLVESFAGTRAVTRPSQDATMGFQAPTTIKEVAARPGASVAKGQVILRGDDAEDVALLKLQQLQVENPLPVARARAAMELADVEYKRLREILDRGGSASQLEVDRARLNYEVARIDFETAQLQQAQNVIQLERLQARVERVRLQAPFDGVVDSVLADVGQIINESQVVIRVVSVDPLWIDVNAPTSDARTLTLQPGDQAWILADVAGNARLTGGKVVEVAPTADSASRTRRVRVELPNPAGPQRLLAGEPVWVRFAPPAGDLATRQAPAQAAR